jgi:arsenite methyltransferase
MNTDETKELVRNWYGSVAAGNAAGCGSGATPRMLPAAWVYSEAELASLPEGADLGLGCGNPQALAAMRRGEVVVDLGSGAGIDCFLAAQQVGPAGRSRRSGSAGQKGIPSFPSRNSVPLTMIRS